MQKFLLRAVKPKKDDPFGFYSNDEYVYLYCKGLKDLRMVIRHIAPRAYRIRSAQWFSKYLRVNNNSLVLEGGFLTKHEKYRIIKIDNEPVGYKTIQYVNIQNQSYPLKAFTSVTEIEVIKSLFD